MADLASFAVSTAVALAMASAGYGAWSLAWSRVAGSVVLAVCTFVLSSRIYRPAWDAAMARSLLLFGMPLAGASIVVFAVMNLDYAVVGNILGPERLGVYVLAFNLSGWPVGAFSATVRAVSLPAFSELQDDPLRHQASFGRALGLLFVPVVPACVLLGVLGGPLVRVVYGGRWSDAAVPLALLAVLGGARVALELAYDFLVSAGRSTTAFRLNLLWLASLVPLLIVSAHIGGITAVAAGHVIAVAVVVLPAHLVALHRLGVSSRSIVGPITRPLVGGAACGVAAWLAAWVVPGDLGSLVVGAAAGVLVYGALVGVPCGSSTAIAGRTSPARPGRPRCRGWRHERRATHGAGPPVGAGGGCVGPGGPRPDAAGRPGRRHRASGSGSSGPTCWRQPRCRPRAPPRGPPSRRCRASRSRSPGS